MARLITKFKYLKPNARKSVGGYAKYIATREGVDKIDASYKLEPSSKKQRHLIEKILRDFPDSKEMFLYHIVSERNNANRAMIVTTNCDSDLLYEKYDDRIAARLTAPSRMNVIEFVGTDVRRFAHER